MAGLKHWLWQLVIALDQLTNVLVTPFQTGAWADETLSCRAYRMEIAGKPWGRILRPLIDLAFFWDTDHCHMSYLSERERRQLPPELRGSDS